MFDVFAHKTENLMCGHCWQTQKKGCNPFSPRKFRVFLGTPWKRGPFWTRFFESVWREGVPKNQKVPEK